MRILKMVALAVLLLMPLKSEGQDLTRLSPADVSQMNEASSAFAKAVLARDWKAVAALYVDEAVLYPPGETSVKGRAAIEACFVGLPAMQAFTLRNTKVEGRDDVAYIQGTYLMTIAPPGSSAPVQESGYFLEIRRKQADGRWRIAVHMLTPH